MNAKTKAEIKHAIDNDPEFVRFVETVDPWLIIGMEKLWKDYNDPKALWGYSGLPDDDDED